MRVPELGALVRVHVDHARDHDLPARVEDLAGAGFGELLPDFRHLSVLDRDVADTVNVVQGVDHPSPSDDEVSHPFSPFF